MTKLEEVIKGLEEISDYFFSVYHHSKDKGEIISAKNGCDIVEDALAILKEQEPVPPNLMQNMDGIWNTCKRCGHTLKPAIINAENPKWFFTFPKYCSECGQAVKWNDI